MQSREQWLPFVLLAIIMLLKIYSLVALCTTSSDVHAHSEHEHEHHDNQQAPSDTANKKQKKDGSRS